MQKKSLSFTSLLLLITITAFSQDYQKRWKESCAKADTTAQAQVLKEWSAAKPHDPELFIAYFNYYVSKASKELVSLGPNQGGNGSFQLTDSTGKPVGFLSSSVQYDGAILQKGFEYIDKGILMHPTRLDMRFGRIYMLGKTENYEAFTKEIVETINYGNSIKNAWLWKEGKPLKDPKEFVLGSVQEYIRTIYDTEDDNLLPYMREISETVLKYFPDHVESLANVALTFLINGEYDKALPYLLKAETIAPKDVVVLNNIAQVYKRKNDKRNAKIYFEKIMKYGTKEDVQMAKEQIKELQ